MNTLRQHVPGFCVNGPVTEYLSAIFFTSNDLKDISFVRSYMRDFRFHRLSVSGRGPSTNPDKIKNQLYLMCEFDAGRTWFVIGMLENDIEDLVTWVPVQDK